MYILTMCIYLQEGTTSGCLSWQAQERSRMHACGLGGCARAPIVPFCPCRLANLSPTCGMRMERTCNPTP